MFLRLVLRLAFVFNIGEACVFPHEERRLTILSYKRVLATLLFFLLYEDWAKAETEEQGFGGDHMFRRFKVEPFVLKAYGGIESSL